MSDGDYPFCPEPTVPMPAKRGPQPCNRIPATYEDAVARARRGRPKVQPLPTNRPALRRLVRRWLIDHFDELTDTLLNLAERLDRVERRLGEDRR